MTLMQKISVKPPSIHFANLIASQSNGTIVAIAIKDEAIDNLSERAKKACESIGSALIRQVRHGGSWAIIGKKGAPIGSVPEAASNNGPSKATLFFGSPITTATGNVCSVAVKSSGYWGFRGAISVNGITIHSSLSGGVTVAVLGDGECAIQKFKTFTSYQSRDLVDFIKLIPPGRIVLASINDSVSCMTDGGRAALEAIGCAIIRNVGHWEAWTIIGRKGAARGSALEQSHKYSTAIAADVSFGNVRTPFVTVQSDGYGGKGAHIALNGVNMVTTNSHRYGLHVAVIGGGSCNVTCADSFNTQYYHYRNASTNFANLIIDLSTGTFVAISIKGDINSRLSEQAIQAIEMLGSKYIRQVHYCGSWAILGRKGAQQGTVLEAASNYGPTEIVSETLPTTQVCVNKCRVFVESVGNHSLGEYQLIINNSKTSMQKRRGITLVVFEESQCVAESIMIYNTYASWQSSSRLADFLASVPTGRIVVASVWDEAQCLLTEEAKLALESIGSALIRGITHGDAWAIVGRKGAAPGSVPESWIESYYDQGTSVAVGGVMELKAYSCDVLYPLKCLTSGQQCINLQAKILMKCLRSLNYRLSLLYTVYVCNISIQRSICANIDK